MSQEASADSQTLGRALCVITGASKGFGRALTLQVARVLRPGSALVLVARSELLLGELREELRGCCEELEVHCVAADLSTKAGVRESVSAARLAAVDDVDRILLINNAASLGDISRPSRCFDDPEEVNSYLYLNVSSALALTAGILQAVPSRPGLRWTVVNLSSAYATDASANKVLYCTGKAARDMMFRVLAEEEPHVRVLSYSPGPLDTQMQEQILRVDGSLPYELRPCHESAAKLMKLLLDDKFESGAHVDVFSV